MPSPLPRPCALVALSTSLVLLAACSSTATRGADAPPSRSVASPSATTIAPAGSTLNITRTCADIAAITTLDDQFNGVRSLAAGVTLAHSLKKAADTLLLNIVDDISTDAHTYDAALGVVVPYVDRASSESELATEVKRDGTLSSALSQMSTAGSNLIGWHAANC